MATQGYTDYGDVNQNHGGVAGEFLERQKNRGFGIQNVATATTTQRPSDAKQNNTFNSRSGSRVSKQAKERIVRPKISPGNYSNMRGKLVANSSNVGNHGVPHPQKIVLKKEGVSLASARFQVALAAGWTGLLNALSFAFGMLTLVVLGATVTVDTIVSYVPGGETIYTAISWFMGWEVFNVWILALFCLIFYFFLVLTMFAGAYLQLKLGGLEPVNGRSSGLKSLALIGAFVISLIPGANFIPWIWMWLFIVALFPN